MYITINKIRYPCTGYVPGGDTVTFSGVQGLELPVAGTVTLCADDDFELAVQEAGGYVRQTLANGVLTLTNLPEPESIPEPEPIEPMPDPSADRDEMLIDHEYRLTLLELGVS